MGLQSFLLNLKISSFELAIKKILFIRQSNKKRFCSFDNRIKKDKMSHRNNNNSRNSRTASRNKSSRSAATSDRRNENERRCIHDPIMESWMRNLNEMMAMTNVAINDLGEYLFFFIFNLYFKHISLIIHLNYFTRT